MRASISPHAASSSNKTGVQIATLELILARRLYAVKLNWRNIPIPLTDRPGSEATVALRILGQLGNNVEEAVGMKATVRAERNRAIVYWLATTILAMELLVGGAWDVLMLPQVREVIHRVGYPVYFLVILGVWKILGSIAIIIPRFPRLKEWAYAGVVFNLTGALTSNLVSGVHDATPLVYLVGMMGITAVSWALRPPSRCTLAVS